MPDGSLRFLDLEGNSIGGPLEWTRSFVELPGDPDRWEETRVWLHGTRLQVSRRRLGDRVRTVAAWPRGNPGGYRLRCIADDEEYRRDLTIAPAKIRPSEFARLLEDLEARLPTSIVVRLRRLGALTGLEHVAPTENTPDQELLRLRRAVRGTDRRPGLAQVLRVLARGHHRILERHDLWLRRERVRRPAPARLAEALRRGSNLEFDERFERGVLPLRVADARVRHTADVYENRLVASFTREVDFRLRRLRAFFAHVARPEAEEEAGALLRELVGGRRLAAFLDEVRPLATPPTRVTMVLQQNPAYRAALEGYRELHRSVRVATADPKLEAPLRNLPALYQTWATLVVVDALLRFAERNGFDVVRQAVARPGWRSVFIRVLGKGREALLLRHPDRGIRIRVIPERSYGPAGGTLRSYTFPQVPDISILIESPNGGQRLVLYDPKYKLWSETSSTGEFTSRPKKEDIDKMHAYRDAIVDAGGRRVVEHAAILFPGETCAFGQEVAALRAIPGEEGSLMESVIATLDRVAFGH